VTRFWYNTRWQWRFRRAQATLEYTLALAGLIVAVSIIWMLVDAARGHAERTENLVTSECP